MEERGVYEYQKFNLFFLFLKITLLQFRLAQNRFKSTMADFIAVNWYYDGECGAILFSIFCMTAGLGNKKEALTLKDFYNQPQRVWLRHIEDALKQQQDFLPAPSFLEAVYLQNITLMHLEA